MKTSVLLVTISLVGLAGCKNFNQTDQETKPLDIQSILTEKQEGDCEDATFESKCAKVVLSLPSVTDGSEELKSAVTAWAQDFAIAMLDPSVELGKMPAQAQAVDNAIQNFISMHQQAMAEIPDGPGYYVVEVSDSVMLNDGKYLTLFLNGYSYAGGAHPNPSAAVATFEAETGNKLTVEDFVTNTDNLRGIAEKKYREVKADAMNGGFDFTPDWPFKIADNVGLTENGIFFCYVPYEVAPYAVGFAEFIISYEELKGILKEPFVK